MLIVMIVIYLFLLVRSNENEEESGFVEHWIVVRGGVFEGYVWLHVPPGSRNLMPLCWDRSGLTLSIVAGPMGPPVVLLAKDLHGYSLTKT
jgi:hypothetical protein